MGVTRKAAHKASAELFMNFVFSQSGQDSLCESGFTAYIPIEVGIVFEALADSQIVASKIAQLARQPLLHHPIPEWSGSITTIAYLHNPPQLERGPVYQFNLNHVILPTSHEEMFRMELIELGAPTPTGFARAPR
jgi:hypothetical protein